MTELDVPDAEVAGITDRELRACTVRIDIGGAPKGSGFFVAPGHVLTCAHVLESLDLTSANAVEAISVSDVRDAPYTVMSVPDDWPDDDLAILRVTPANQHPCVLLIPGLRLFDRFLTFGYPERHREGLARPLVAQGMTGDERLQSLGEGQIEPGMSGAPVLNLRTGGVCGVLSRTRDASQDLGGYAIPIEKLKIRSPALTRQNQAYHEAYRDWFDLLPAVEKSVLLSGRAGRASAERLASFFVVSVGREANEWEVSATLYLEGQPAEPIGPQEVDLNLVRDKVARLFRDWASRGRAGPEEVALGRFDPGEDVRLLGSILFSAVLPGEIGSRLESMLGEGDDRIQLALHFSRGIRKEIVEMPWEHLYVPRPGIMTDVHVARAERITLVRVSSPEPREDKQLSRRQLTALMVGVTPPEQADGSTVREVLTRAQTVATDLMNFTLEPLEMPSPEKLAEKVENGAYDIVHYVGFGRYMDGADRLALGGSPDFEYVNAEMFAARLARRRPAVVVLQQIEGPRDFIPADLSIFAWELLNHGVEAVVGYQFPLPATLSMEFDRTLYQQLAAGQSFDVAVQKGRSALWMKRQELHAFLSPAAFMARPGELVLTAPPENVATLTRVGVTAAHG